jgi:hypothetical protein
MKAPKEIIVDSLEKGTLTMNVKLGTQLNLRIRLAMLLITQEKV